MGAREDGGIVLCEAAGSAEPEGAGGPSPSATPWTAGRSLEVTGVGPPACNSREGSCECGEVTVEVMGTNGRNQPGSGGE